MNQVKKAAYTVVAMHMDDKKINELKNTFMAMDSNKDGTVSILELKRALDNAGLDLPGSIDDIMEAADTDGSGVIDYTEFLAATLDKKHCRQENICWTAFKKFDLDGSDTIE